jgi:hypothetical protein
MGLKLIITAYFTLVATIFIAGIVVLSVGQMSESRADALENGYLVTR